MNNIELLNEAETPLPLGVIDKIDSEIETRLNARYLDLRKSEIAANFQIRAAVSGAVHKHLRREKFLEVQTPKIIASATEGGTSLFEMKYFDKTAYLAQSPQLYKQMLMGGGLTEATAKLKRQGLKKGGFVARGCGAIMSGRSKKTKMM